MSKDEPQSTEERKLTLDDLYAVWPSRHQVVKWGYHDPDHCSVCQRIMEVGHKLYQQNTRDAMKEYDAAVATPIRGEETTGEQDTPLGYQMNQTDKALYLDELEYPIDTIVRKAKIPRKELVALLNENDMPIYLQYTKYHVTNGEVEKRFDSLRDTAKWFKMQPYYITNRINNNQTIRGYHITKQVVKERYINGTKDNAYTPNNTPK